LDYKNDSITILNLPKFIKEDQLKQALERVGTSSVEDVCPRSKKTIGKRSYTIQIRPVLRAVFSSYSRGSNTAVCSIEYDNITPALRVATFGKVRYQFNLIRMMTILLVTTIINFTFDDDQSNQLVKQIANIYISHDDKFNSELKEQLNALKDEETSKEIQRLEQELLQQNKQVASIEKNSNYFDNP
ncbi:unnamed protein product, partial [Rotaria socialis]